MKIIPIFLMTILSIALMGCSSQEARQQIATNKIVIAKAGEGKIDLTATRVIQNTLTPFPTYTTQATLTVLPTLTPNIIYMTPTFEKPMPTEVRETLAIMGQNVPCGEDFYINLYKFEEQYGFGSPYDSSNGVFKIVRVLITNRTHKTIAGLSSNDFILTATDKAGSKKTYSPDTSTSSFMNEGREGNAIGKTPWEDITMYVPLVPVRSLIVFDVPLKLTSFELTFKASASNNCSVTIPIR